MMEIAIVVGALLVSLLIFTWLLKVVRATFKTALLVAMILLLLQLAFGIGPGVIWAEIQSWFSRGFESIHQPQ